MKRARIFVVGGSLTAWCGLSALAAAPIKASKPARPAPAKAPAAGAKQAQPAPSAGQALPRETMEFFEKEVRPVLAEQCYSCHGEKIQQAGLRLDSRAWLLKGGDTGPALDLKKPAASLLLKAVRHEGLQMPPGRKLPAKQLAALEKWVGMGAPWPGSGGAGPAVSTSWNDVLHARKQWWSLQPVRKSAAPLVKNAKWSADPIDRFILSSLEKKGLKPAPRADRRTLIRRLYLTLVGLPPKPEEVEQFVKDPSPKAYEQLVDRLLASPHFGERWARHWMDVVRFGENHGYEWNYEVRDAWRYRDYLIRAFNQDLPYDQFIREHIAGDLLANPRVNAEEKTNESIVGTAFYRFGEAGHDVFKEIGLDVLDGQIDTLSKAFQAATVSCARCHDHKLDAVSTKDYYALLGVLASSRQVIHTLDRPEAHEPAKQQLRDLKKDLRREIGEVWRVEAKEMGRYLAAAQATRDGKMPAEAMPDMARVKAWAEAATKATAMEDPLFPWQSIAKPGTEIATAWQGLATRYQTEIQSRKEFNEKNFIVLGDFRDGTMDGWRVDGIGLRDGPVKSGDFAVAGGGDKALMGVLPAGMFTYSLSDQFNGSMQSPDLPADARQISFEAIGGKQGAIRVVPDFRHLNDAGQQLKPERLYWARAGRSERDERVYVELVTKLDSQRYDRVGKNYKPGKSEDTRSFFGVTRVLIHKTGEGPKAELEHVSPLFREAAPQNLDQAAERYAAYFQAAVNAWASDSATDEHVRVLNWLLEKNLLTNSVKANPRIAELLRRYREIDQEIPAPKVAAGLADQGPGIDHPVYLRGDFRNVGDMVPRRYLEVLSSAEDRFSAAGSGRLQLADRIIDRKNPLTARVMVNRVWHWLYGTGIVRSVDDFGHMGEEPSHPELLDYLATAFSSPATVTLSTQAPSKKGKRTPSTPPHSPTPLRGLNWSVKKLIRHLVLTETFQQQSRATAQGMEVDPENRLLHHYPARRAEAEVIRDSMLSVSGRLDPTLYGSSIHPYRPQEKGDRKLFSGPLDGDGRRSVYTRITLMEGPPFLGVFNQPEAKVAQGRRDVTNVPAQALTLMNDPFVIQQAQVWADALLTQADANVTARLDRMFLTALGRKPAPAETVRFETAVRELAELHQVQPDGVMKHRDLWKDVAHAVFNLKEFIYVR